MIEENFSGAYYRVTLLVYVLEKETISDETAERIIRIVSEAPHGMQEQYSEQLLAMLKSCSSEEEVIQALNLKIESR
ncbi:MAG: hypothetical protein PUD55_03025 [Firmicutes bacterium]|nr:hypothetical protein [Bacillota bacterium]